MVDFVSAMGEAADAVAFLEGLGDFGANFFDCAGIVAANLEVLVVRVNMKGGWGEAYVCAFAGKEINVLPVCWILWGSFSRGR